MPDKSCDYLVIGGGISGLTAAYELLKDSRATYLLDPSPSLGGCIKTVYKEGFTLEQGATTLVLTPELSALFEELNLLETVIEPTVKPFRQYVWHAGSPHFVPKTPGELFQTSLFTVHEKIKIILGLFKTIPESMRQKTLTLSEIFGYLFGTAVVTKALDPALRGIYGGDVSKLLGRYVFAKITKHLEAGGSLFSYIRQQRNSPRKIFHMSGGNSLLIERLKAAITDKQIIRSSAQNITVNPDGGYIVTTENGETIAATAVLIATSGNHTARFLQSLSSSTASALSTLRYAPITVVHVAVPEDTHLLHRAFGILFPSGSDSQIIGALFNSQLFPGTAPSGSHLITICLGGIHTLGHPPLKDGEVEVTVRRELGRFLQISDLKILSIHHWENAIPQYESGIQTIHAELHALETRHPGIKFAGVDTGGVGIPDRITTALRSAQELIADRSRQPHA